MPDFSDPAVLDAFRKAHPLEGQFIANRLYRSFGGHGTDDESLTALIELDREFKTNPDFRRIVTDFLKERTA